MDKNYLSKKILIIFLILIGILSYNKENYSNLYIKITDINRSIESNNKEKAILLVEEFEEEFKNTKNSNSEKGLLLQKELEEKVDISFEKTKKIATLLLEFDKEQNPENLKESKKKFKSKILPALDNFKIVIKSKDLETIKKEYNKFNNIWTRNESFIRDKDIVYYGKVETAISLLRVAIESEPTNYENIVLSFEELNTTINDYIDGKFTNEILEKISLASAIDILKKASELYKAGDLENSSKEMKKFINIWPSVEGEIRTRNSSLYTKVETNVPIILAKADVSSLDNLISELLQINTTAKYNFLDAMFILLREGVEALVIVMALISSMRAVNNKKAIKYIYSGAIAGIVFSFTIAIILQLIFPNINLGLSREFLEAIVGIIAVIIMLFVGHWLHSKSSLKSWNEYINREINVAVGTGSMITMFTLSFLAVFREGAETILFYVGIIPLITLKDLIIGIVLAVIILGLIAILMVKTSAKIEIHKIFKILTWVIYLLAFKMLGVSIHMLQVIGYLPITVIKYIPTIEMIGIYANYQVLIPQVLLVLIVYILIRNKE